MKSKEEKERQERIASRKAAVGKSSGGRHPESRWPGRKPVVTCSCGSQSSGGKCH